MSVNSKLLLLFLLFQLAILKRASPHLSHQHHVEQPVGQSGPRLLQSLIRDNIRITVNTLLLRSVTTSTTQSVLTFIEKAVDVTRQFLVARVKVSPESGNNMAPATCVDYPTTSSDRNMGIALSDLHIYVSYITDNTQLYLSTGEHCRISAGGTASPNADPTLARGRPIMGRLKFNTAYGLDGVTLTNRLFAQLTSWTLQSMIHIMGFNSNLFSTYLNPATNNTYTYSVMQTATGLSSGRSTTMMIVTPFVKDWIRNWYDCGDLDGMLLENQASDGNNYWDRTLMYDEVMTKGRFGPQKSISGLTFALLKDMGWYTVDDTFNDTSSYGYKQQCDFFRKGCNHTSQFKQFCDPTSTVKSCMTNFLSKAVCQVDAYSDKCGIWVSSLHCVDPNAQDDGFKTASQETYGTSSFCISSTLASVALDANLQSRCYPYVCYDNNAIKFQIGLSSILCSPTDAGTQKTLSGFSGTLTCPQYNDFCWVSRKICPSWCSQNGICTRGVCNCRSGYSGDDCSKTICVTTSTNYNPNTNTCLSLCPSTTYGNAYSHTCMPCVNCTECQTESTICTSCVGGIQVMYNNVCLDECPERTYLNGSRCLSCISPCWNCTSNTASTCTSCDNSLYLSTDSVGTCGSTCTISTYPMKDEYNHKCVSSCPDNLVQVGVDTCQLCGPGLYKNNSNLCNETCPDGYYPDNTRRFCGLCHTDCRLCISVYAQNCTACWSNKINRFLYLGQCVLNTSCPLGTYADQVGLTCTQCPYALNCSTCVNGSTGISCLKCAYGWYMNSAGLCVTTCAANQYQNNGNNSCVNCHSTCAACTSGTNSSCTACTSTNKLLTNTTGGYCLTACPQTGYYQDSSQCLACYSSCFTCVAGLISNCTSCVSGMFLYNGHCYFACPSLTYKDNSTRTCRTCNQTCTFCFGPLSTNCSQCASGYYLNNVSCITSCPSGLEPNQWSVCSIATRLLLAVLLLAISI